MNTITLSLTNEEINKLINTYKNEMIKANNQYIKYQIKDENVLISVYNSNKVVFQGKDAHIYAAAFIKKDIRMAGSDEVGTGDYFGPVCVCAAIIEVEDYKWLRSLGIDDSKKMNDTYILKIGQELINRLKHSLLILNPKQYNKVHLTNNMNEIKAKLHNKAYINLIYKGYDIPKAAYVDQFEAENLYFNHIKNEADIYKDLNFETKAETKYLAVAAASVIARYAFIKSMMQMNKDYNFEFPKGAGDIVDEAGINFIKLYSKDKLNEVAKIHFKNTLKIEANL